MHLPPPQVYDPKLPARASPAQLQERAKGPFRDSIVFMIGGGNYLECHSLRFQAHQKIIQEDRLICRTTDGAQGNGQGAAYLPKYSVWGYRAALAN
eukprot:scaffold670235_cov37-Prasinocladus_malaysianus.AAC.1